MRTIAEIFRSYAVLDANGRHVGGTDKASNHAYSAAYELILGGMRTQANCVLEIGNADGSSLLAWREIFPFAHVVGLDIHPSEKALGERLEFHLGDATQKEVCDRVAQGMMFDFICEDATHLLEDNLRTLLYLWPSVKPGGIYVIEEMANVNALREHIVTLFPQAEIVDTVGPSGGVEPLVVFRKKRLSEI